MKRFWSIAILTLLLSQAVDIIGQEIVHEHFTVQWTEDKTFTNPLEVKSIEAPNFVGGQFNAHLAYLPLFHHSFNTGGPGKLEVKIENLILEDVKASNASFKKLKSSVEIESGIRQSRKKFKGMVEFVPIIQQAPGVYQKVLSFDLRVSFKPNPRNVNSRNGPFAQSSLLNTGQWYKIATQDEDVYKLSFDFFTNDLDIPSNSINPSLIKVYGNGGGIVPESNSAERIDDLEEIAIQFVGDQDDIFETDEYFLFYAESSDDRGYNTETNRLEVTKNPYSFDNHYLIRIDGSQGQRIQSSHVGIEASISTSQYLDIQHFESELFNVLDYRSSSHGSGKRWFGELFTASQARDFFQEFDLSNYISPQKISWVSECAVVSFTNNSRFTISVGDNSASDTFAKVPIGTGNDDIALRVRTLSGESSSTIDKIEVNFSPTSSESSGWLDYIQLIGEKHLTFGNGENTKLCRDRLSLDHAAVNYNLSSVLSDIIIWDLSNKRSPTSIRYDHTGSVLSFVLASDTVNEFISIDPNGALKSPTTIGPVANQNLHAIDRANLLVVYNNEFKAVADRLIDHRRERDGLLCQGVDISHIYNEFSSGSVDASALRDFCRMVYERDPEFKYLLLVGDGTFDMRHIRDDVADQNFICTYQTTESQTPIFSYPSDDYFTLLDEEEGGNLRGGMDLGVGRFPIQSLQQGNAIVDKIIQYEADAQFKGDWKQFITLVADDEDNDLHFKDSRDLSINIEDANPEYELSKINLDAFEQEANSAGDRYPEVNQKINSNFAKGQFIFNYYGHGGNRGLGQERILTIPDIDSWDQKEGYPIIVTATCSFASFDDPDFESAGEIAINKSSGGAIALLSTTRIVFAAQNDNLVRELFDRILEKNSDGSLQRIGDVIINAKNDLSFSSEENSRKFSLFGDPSMEVPLPFYDIVTTTINDKDVTNSSSDTLGALQRVTVSGHIASKGVKINDFNGELSAKVFDKPITLRTLGQDQGSNEKPFNVQNNVLFQGRSSIVNGDFTYSFIVPRDINYEIGEGKILHYANNDGNLDAGGVQERVIIGGTSANGIVDNEPPTIELFLNSESFENGSIVPNKPILLANLSDDFGINIAGTSVGHDLITIIDGDVKNTIILNEFYKAKLDKATEGTLEYQLSTLEEGLHQLTLRVWDIANNKAEATVEFIIMDRENFSIDRIFNFPNPFTTSTSFQFVHDLPTNSINVQVDIYTMTGDRVKSIQQTIQSNSGLARDIAWNGLDDYGDQLARGVYLYKISILGNNISDTASLSAESDFERLVILK